MLTTVKEQRTPLFVYINTSGAGGYSLASSEGGREGLQITARAIRRWWIGGVHIERTNIRALAVYIRAQVTYILPRCAVVDIMSS